MSKLVIVESPTKAKTIKKFLGTGYVVESSFGHVRDLPKSSMGIDLEGKTFLPSYRVPKDKSDHVKKLKKLADQSNEVIFATDEDREGEAISWHLAEILGINAKSAKRIVFHEITKHAILEALEHPRHLDLHLVDAQQARRILDRIVGYELSPLLWKKIMRGLSAGRVQSVAMRLIVEREREIEAFVPQEYWSITGQFATKKEETLLEGKLHSIAGKTVKKFDIGTKEDADAVLAAVKGASFSISGIEQKEAKRNPVPPFTTSTLQQEANTRLGFSSKVTMRIAQQLYEGIALKSEGSVGLITYMRTDSTNLSDKFLEEASSYISGAYGKEYVHTKRFKSSSKGAQEAHEAIRPTDATKSPEAIKDSLTREQYLLYSLIWRRAISSQMAAAKLNKNIIDITGNDHTFRTTGQTMIFPGWLVLYPERVKESVLPTVEKGEGCDIKAITPAQHFTEPPARFNDASLVKILEEHGIGRPSTYAPTIATLENRGYVLRDEQKRLKPQTVAFLVNDMLVEHFPNIVDVDFTAKVEKQFDNIAEGKEEWQEMIKTFYEPFHKQIVEKDGSIERSDVSHAREIGVHPKSGKPIIAKLGPYGPFVQCGSKEDEEKPQFASLEKDQNIDTITLDEALVLLSLPRVVGKDSEGQEILANKGKFGPYVQVGKLYVSLKDESPYTVTEERAKELIAEKKEFEKKKHIHSFQNGKLEVLMGPYGPYIKHEKKNYKIPKDTDPQTLTEEACLQIIEEQKKNPPKKRPRRKKRA